MGFKFDGNVSIKNVNFRTENHGKDEKVVATDISLIAKGVQAEYIGAILGLQDKALLCASLWDIDSASVKFNGISKIDCWATFQDLHKVVFGSSIATESNRVDSFTIKPLADYLCDITFRVAIQDPSANLVDYLVHHIKGDSHLQLIPNEELPLDPSE